MSNSLPTDDAAELTTYIETRFHERHRAQLPLLVQMAEKVETVHGEDAAVPSGLADILRRLIGEMGIHDEEQRDCRYCKWSKI